MSSTASILRGLCGTFGSTMVLESSAPSTGRMEDYLYHLGVAGRLFDQNLTTQSYAKEDYSHAYSPTYKSKPDPHPSLAGRYLHTRMVLHRILPGYIDPPHTQRHRNHHCLCRLKKSFALPRL